jgi:hypothetical protein
MHGTAENGRIKTILVAELEKTVIIEEMLCK